MTRKFIPGLIGAALVAGCLSAQAMPAGDADLTHNYAVTGLAHKGNYVTDLVQRRLITAAPRAAAFTMANADADRARRYASAMCGRKTSSNAARSSLFCTMATDIFCWPEI